MIFYMIYFLFSLYHNITKGVDCSIAEWSIYIKESRDLIKMKITIDEGFFAYFFHLEGKKYGPAGEAIDNISLFLKYI